MLSLIAAASIAAHQKASEIHPEPQHALKRCLGKLRTHRNSLSGPRQSAGVEFVFVGAGAPQEKPMCRFFAILTLAVTAIASSNCYAVGSFQRPEPHVVTA